MEAYYNIQSFWSQPIPILETPREKWTFVLLSGAFSIFFVNVFVPFNINLWWPMDQPWLRWLVLSGYGLLGVPVLLVSQFLLRPCFGPAHYDLASFLLWTLFELLLISVAISLVYEVIIHDSIHGFQGFARDILLTVRYVGLVMCIPYGVAIPIMISRRNMAKVTALQKGLHQHDRDERLLAINDENGKHMLSLPAANLVYLQSADNYVSVTYRSGGALKKMLVRSTLKKLEDQLGPADMVRTHRSFMVNVRNISEVRRVSRGFVINMKGVDEAIPVSSKYQKGLETKIPGTPSPHTHPK